MARESHLVWEYLTETQNSRKNHWSRSNIFSRNKSRRVGSSLDVDPVSCCSSWSESSYNIQDWCRTDIDMKDAEKSNSRDFVHFPYAVVEIKLQEKPPQWLKDIVKSGILLPAPKFSKFLHGTATLYQPITQNVPYWFLPDQEDKELLTPATWDEMEGQTEAKVKDSLADWLFPSSKESRTLVSDKANDESLVEAFDSADDVNTIQSNESKIMEGLMPKSTPLGRRLTRSRLIALLRRHKTSVPCEEDHDSALEQKRKNGADDLLTSSSAYHDTKPPSSSKDENEMESILAINQAIDLIQSTKNPKAFPLPEGSGSDSGGSLTHDRGDGHGIAMADVASSGVQSAGTPSGSERGMRHSVGTSTPLTVSADEMEMGGSHRSFHPSEGTLASEDCLDAHDPASVSGQQCSSSDKNVAESSHNKLEENKLSSAETGIQGGSPQSEITLNPGGNSGNGRGILGMQNHIGKSPASPPVHPSQMLVSSRDSENDQLVDIETGNGNADSQAFSFMQYSMELPKDQKANIEKSSSKGNIFKRFQPRRSPRAIVRTRIEPKTFFANERTFLQWLNISVLVMFLALSLLRLVNHLLTIISTAI